MEGSVTKMTKSIGDLLTNYMNQYFKEVGKYPTTYWATEKEFELIKQYYIQRSLRDSMYPDLNNIILPTKQGMLKVKRALGAWPEEGQL